MNMTYLTTLKNAFSVKQNSEQMFRFLAYSFLFSWLLLLTFLINVNGEQSILGTAYSLIIPLYYYLLFLVVTSLILPLFWIKRLAVCILIPKILFDIVLIGDFFLFGVYRFHVDMMFINMLLHDFKGIGISFGLVLLALFVASLVALVNIVIYRKCHKFPALKLYRINFAVFVVFLLGQVVHVVGYEYRQVNITKYTPYFPYYAPLTSNSLMTKLKKNFPDTFPEVAETGTGQVGNILTSGGKANGNDSLLNYPLQALECKPNVEQSLPNILLFVAESWRQDVMNMDVTPNIAKFGESAIEYTNHFSGGNVTVNGLFSMMYGLHPTYRDFMTAEPFKHQTLLTKTLESLGYDIGVYTSSNLDRFSLKPMFFGDIENKNYVNPLDGNLLQNDQGAVTKLLRDLRSGANESKKPWFKFVFLSSSHHNYQYPKELEKFVPIEKNPEKFLFNKDMDPVPLFNRYKNSVHFIDSMFGDIWQAVEETGQADDTFTIVTSDHGEEFNDNKLGYWGHGNNFTKVQLAVPMLVKPAKSNANDKPKKVTSLTGHIDVVPTILQNIANCQNPTTDYSNGFNLFQLPDHRDGIIAASYKDKAYLINGNVYATGLSVESYKVEDLNNKNEDFDYSGLNKLKQQESHLLQH
ncbi:sulfatase-like hydrolase/transferase [Psychrosphaera sp. 1_MG-2023]|uniref:sulfatase-like hydrolase/transferase n=1 Tax=Psychrosphaera sp. 1_MG-2023 TaxID=3062643 RepID=UPI0026E2EC49|nr:sulfatase-like hydrolase/transferase [Psychrosphaera sp. 1_MG-2023]MDO6719973.1 sulfatase-like hydrolase/transferase [Psychrosphaera sp. 1_MG-2023]